jgi:hypothetical protein
MSVDSFIRVLAICVVLACTETLNGIARIVILNPRLGKKRALKVSFASASTLAFVVCLLLVPGVGLSGTIDHVYLGLVLAAFMALFDIAISTLLFRRSWGMTISDFNPFTGNLLVFGLALLVVFPPIVYYIVRTP